MKSNARPSRDVLIAPEDPAHENKRNNGEQVYGKHEEHQSKPFAPRRRGQWGH